MSLLIGKTVEVVKTRRLRKDNTIDQYADKVISRKQALIVDKAPVVEDADFYYIVQYEGEDTFKYVNTSNIRYKFNEQRI